MKSTRDRILLTLLSNPRSTITDMASSVNINAISVRHHLASLQVEGLVNSREERHGVGRPRLVYSLTEKGMEKFPTHYIRLMNNLLDQIRVQLDEHTRKQLFKQLAEKIASEFPDLTGIPMEKKLDKLTGLMEEQGFYMTWEKIGDQYIIHETNCPYFHVSKKHPEICAIDQDVLSKLLSNPVKRTSCVITGDTHCTYIIHVESD